MSMNDHGKSINLLENMMNVSPTDPTLLIEMSKMAESHEDYSNLKILTDVSMQNKHYDQVYQSLNIILVKIDRLFHLRTLHTLYSD